MNIINEIEDGRVIVKRLAKYLVAYKTLLAVSIVSMVVMALTETSFAALMKPLTDVSFIERDDELIYLAPMALVAIFLIRSVSAVAAKICLDLVTRNIIKQMRNEMFERVLRLPTKYFDRNSSGHLISKFIYDVEQVANAINTSIMTLIKETLTIIGLLAWMIYMDWVLTLVLLFVLPLLGLIVRYVSKRFRVLSQRIQTSIGNVTNIAEEVVGGQRIVKIYGGEKYELQHFDDVNEYNRIQQMKRNVTEALNINVLQTVVAACFAGIIYFAIKQGVTAGTFVSFMFAMMMLLPSIRNISNVNATIQQGITAASSVFQLLDEPIETDVGTHVIHETRGQIEFNIQSFAYDKSKGDVLHDIRLRIEPGQSVAFVGRSGSGKSTLVNLLPRFYMVDRGHISLDGINVNDINLKSLREHISIVSQDVVLFNDTIERNIAYGGLSNSSEEEIIEAARAAHAMEFIEKLPDGFNTIVGESGTLLSGGQRQRLAIARALLKNAPILILDEATSALDTQSERHIQDALMRLMKNRTTLVIAHRLSTIENVDKIIVMDNGRIIEIGTHSELLEKNGAYADLYKLQFNS